MTLLCKKNCVQHERPIYMKPKTPHTYPSEAKKKLHSSYFYELACRINQSLCSISAFVCEHISIYWSNRYISNQSFCEVSAFVCETYLCTKVIHRSCFNLNRGAIRHSHIFSGIRQPWKPNVRPYGNLTRAISLKVVASSSSAYPSPSWCLQ